MIQGEDNGQLQEDEICALESIYGEGFLHSTDTNSYCVHIPEATGPHISLRFHLPDNYPSTSLPVFELSCECLTDDVLGQLSSQLESEFSPGEPVLFIWVEALKERWQVLVPESQPGPDDALVDAAAEVLAQTGIVDAEEAQHSAEHGQHGGVQDGAPQQSGHPSQHGAAAEVAGSIVHGEPLTEKRSTFQAHLAPVQSTEQVEAVMEVLMRNNKVRAATHNIMAFRIEQADKGGALLQDCDDDKEAAAGGRLLHLLQMVDARNVVLVVSRWYGGILLGPARFTHINNAARQLLDACGYIEGGGKASGEGGGKSKGKKRGGK